MKNNKTYRTIGMVFMVSSLIVLALRQIGLFAAWFSIGAAFYAIGSSDETATKQPRKKNSKK